MPQKIVYMDCNNFHSVNPLLNTCDVTFNIIFCTSSWNGKSKIVLKKTFILSNYFDHDYKSCSCRPVNIFYYSRFLQQYPIYEL